MKTSKGVLVVMTFAVLAVMVPVPEAQACGILRRILDRLAARRATVQQNITYQTFAQPSPMMSYSAPPVSYSAPPVMYSSPPVTYSSPPPMTYSAPPPVVYSAPPPVIQQPRSQPPAQFSAPTPSPQSPNFRTAPTPPVPDKSLPQTQSFRRIETRKIYLIRYVR